MFEVSIHSRVMKVVKTRIEQAQKKYNLFCKEADKVCIEDIKARELQNKREKESKADELVQEVFEPKV